MSDSIFNTVKKMLGLPADYTPFDTDILVHINGVFLTLQQLGVGPKDGFSITGPDETWDEFLDQSSLLEAVKNYIYLKVRVAFDPPTGGSVLDAMKEQIAEYEWRINVQVDPQKGGEN